MYFKIKIEDTFCPHWKKQNDKRYRVTYEIVPECVNGNIVYHRAEFTSFRAAENFAAQLTLFFEDVFNHVDLIYFRLKSLPLYDCDIKQTDQRYFHALLSCEKYRNKIFCGSHSKDFAANHIKRLSGFINSILILLPYYCRANTRLTEILFRQLQQVKDYFIQTYRSAASLHECNNLNYLQP